jgi:anti-sigma regulatory factor (Ser/Thr protein kinase)
MPALAVKAKDEIEAASVQGVLDLLSTASRLLSNPEDYEAALPALARLLVPAWAQACAIGLCKEGDPSKVRVVAELGRTPEETAVKRRRPHPPITTLRDGDGWSLEVAIASREQGFGFLWLGGTGPAPSDIVTAIAEELALRIAIAIDAARAIEREHHVAETLQRALLPEQLPRSPVAILDAAYRPAAGESVVGGDWYDAFELPDGRIGVSIGDVAGHGLSAAVVMSEARQAVRASSFDARSPSEVLARANHMLRSVPMMVTALVGFFEPRTSTFTYASAGHPPPLVVTAEGHAFVFPIGDAPLGVTDEIAPSDWTFTLQPGSLLVLYTDGILEYGRDILAGEAELARALRDEMMEPSERPAASLQDRVLGLTPNNDDVATLTLLVPARRQDTFDCTFSAVPFSAPYVRRGLERYLIDREVDEERRFAVITAVGEAVANAVEHAYLEKPGTVRLCVRLEDAHVLVHVEDFGRWRPANKLEDRGRGIPLMRALMDRVEIRSDRSSTQIRMQLQTA